MRIEDKKNKYYRALKRLLSEIVIYSLLILFIFTSVIGVTVQRGNDMYPFIRDGDIIIYYRHAGLLPTEAVVYKTSGILRTGRIAAASGSEIASTGDHQLTIDGAYLAIDEEHGIYSKTKVKEGFSPMRVSNNAYYILNDDRNRINDSRSHGEIPADMILGRIVSILRVRTI